eukprot:6186694-Pleurochrysis_carterae.AAC.1
MAVRSCVLAQAELRIGGEDGSSGRAAAGASTRANRTGSAPLGGRPPKPSLVAHSLSGMIAVSTCNSRLHVMKACESRRMRRLQTYALPAAPLLLHWLDGRPLGPELCVVTADNSAWLLSTAESGNSATAGVKRARTTRASRCVALDTACRLDTPLLQGLHSVVAAPDGILF